MKKIKSVKRNGLRYYVSGCGNIWQSEKSINNSGLAEWITEDVIRNCPLFEVEYEKERWRAEPNYEYYSLDSKLKTYSTTDVRDEKDDYLYSIGWYFRTEDQAERFREILKSELEKFHRSEGNYD